MSAEPLHIDVPGYKGPERRTEFRLWREQVDRRFEEMRTDMQTNTAATQQVQVDTAELVQWLKSLKGAFAVLDVIGRAAKPLGAIAVLCTSAWVFFQTVKGGGTPK